MEKADHIGGQYQQNRAASGMQILVTASPAVVLRTELRMIEGYFGYPEKTLQEGSLRGIVWESFCNDLLVSVHWPFLEAHFAVVASTPPIAISVNGVQKQHKKEHAYI